MDLQSSGTQTGNVAKNFHTCGACNQVDCERILPLFFLLNCFCVICVCIYLLWFIDKNDFFASLYIFINIAILKLYFFIDFRVKTLGRND